jgi:single-strand DNA-binding protein
MGTPVVWEGNVGNAAEHRSFANGNKDPRHMLRLNVMFDNSIPDGQGGYKDRGGSGATSNGGIRMPSASLCVPERHARPGHWPRDHGQLDGQANGEEVSALKVEASRIAILPHRIEHVSLARGGRRPANQPQGQARSQTSGQAQNVPQPSPDDMRHYEGFDDDIPL